MLTLMPLRKSGLDAQGDPGSITACNCKLCRRYGWLLAYDYEGERVAITGETASYTRAGREKSSLEVLFCPTCACLLGWRGLRVMRMAVGYGRQRASCAAGRCLRPAHRSFRRF